MDFTPSMKICGSQQVEVRRVSALQTLSTSSSRDSTERCIQSFMLPTIFERHFLSSERCEWRGFADGQNVSCFLAAIKVLTAMSRLAPPTARRPPAC